MMKWHAIARKGGEQIKGSKIELEVETPREAILKALDRYWFQHDRDYFEDDGVEKSIEVVVWSPPDANGSSVPPTSYTCTVTVVTDGNSQDLEFAFGETAASIEGEQR